jgi:Fic family protein
VKVEEFEHSPAGTLITTIGGYSAFVPNTLPPELEINWELAKQISDADRSLSELSGAASRLLNPHLLIMPFVRKEAVLSSRIEGTQASLSELLSYEASSLFPDMDNAGDDVHEVANYVGAMEFGLKRLPDLPISLRLITELHERLMRGVRGEDKMPGQFRARQNWIGPPGTDIENATYVPPPGEHMMRLLDDLEKYIHAPKELPPLVRLAIIHYQFEAIHPFLDGNGRIGRLLITLLMVAEGLLPQPLLFLSAYFEKSRQQYYDHLLAITQRGAWNEWIIYFLRGINIQSRDARERSATLLALLNRYRYKVQTKRSSGHIGKLIELLFSRPVINAKMAQECLDVTPRAAQLHIDRLISEGILREATGKKRNRVYAAPEILQALEI